MVEHRRANSKPAFVPSSWLIVLTILVCIGAAGWLGWIVLGDSGSDDTPAADATRAPSVTATTPSTSTAPTTTPAPSASTSTPTPTEATSSAPAENRREVPVAVLNNTTTRGLAATFAAKVRTAGWQTVTVGNWRGSVQGNTVYYPPAFADLAQVLAKDVGIGRIRPSVSPMRPDRLTIILSGPQQ